MSNLGDDQEDLTPVGGRGGDGDDTQEFPAVVVILLQVAAFGLVQQVAALRR